MSETIHPISPKLSDETPTVNNGGSMWVVHHCRTMTDVRHLEN